MILIALGANLPSNGLEPIKTQQRALARLNALGVEVVAVSSFYETPAWPDVSDPPFVYAVATVRTRHQPVELLALLHGVETEFGRLRSAPNAPRTLDLDLLDHDGVVTTDGLTLPHPRIADRAFVLVPLAEVAPDWRHPVSGQGVMELLSALPPGEAAAVKKLA